MKERPILMTPENAQKCHDGTKTQTRRLNGLGEINEDPGSWACTFLDSVKAFVFGRQPAVPRGHRQIQCPYGVVGDRLWVREAWGMSYIDIVPTGRPFIAGGTWGSPSRPLRRACAVFKADGPMPDDSPYETARWCPSIHMPRWACRTVLEITEVRVERLQEITEEDAKAEGCKPHPPSGLDGRVYRRPFECLWGSINGAGSWDLNPWVWVIAFKKVRPE